MRIARRTSPPIAWVLHDLSPADRRRLEAFLAQWDGGSRLDPYHPVLLSFDQPEGDVAFAQAFAGAMEP
jgi:hypothetical protein